VKEMKTSRRPGVVARDLFDVAVLDAGEVLS
jgi:hypothetical protein